jgi:MIP family channel proteins
MLRGTARECAAEFLGTLVLVTFGVAVVAQVVLGEKSHGEYLSINLGWGLAVTMGILIAGGVSGAHLNPAVTLAVAVCQDFPWRKVLPYCLAQTAGAFVASAIVFGVYHQALVNLAGETRDQSTAGIWATYPQDYLTLGGGLIDQVVGTALLVGVVFAIGDKRNANPTSFQGAIAVGLLVVLIGMTFGLNAGYAINPARDFGPRLFTAIAGWGPEVFRWGNGFWWVPIVGPLAGGIIGGWLYLVLVGRQHPPEV